MLKYFLIAALATQPTQAQFSAFFNAVGPNDTSCSSAIKIMTDAKGKPGPEKFKDLAIDFSACSMELASHKASQDALDVPEFFAQQSCKAMSDAGMDPILQCGGATYGS